MKKANNNNRLLWTWRFIDEKTDFDDNWSSKEQAQQAANEYYIEYCADLDSENTYCSDDIELIKFYYDSETDEPVVVHREMGYVEAEYYQGDFKEHNIWNRSNL